MKNQKLTNNATPERAKPIHRGKDFRDLMKRIALIGVVLCFLFFIIPSHWRFVYFSTTLFLLALGIGVRALQVLHPGKYEFTEFFGIIVNWYESLERRQQLYLNVNLCLPFLGFLYLLDAKNLFAPTSILFFIYCLGVAAYDIYRIYAILYETPVGKGLIAIAFAAGSNLAFSISGNIISGMTHVPSITFPHTLSFLAIFAIPFLFIAAGAIFIPVSVVMAPFLIYGSSFAKNAPRLTKWFFGVEVDGKGSRYIVATMIFQIAFYSAIGAFTPAAFLHLLNRYNQQIESAIGKSIYEFDMYSGTECKTASSYRQAPLGDENYILASKHSTGIIFEPSKKCAL